MILTCRFPPAPAVLALVAATLLQGCGAAGDYRDFNRERTVHAATDQPEKVQRVDFIALVDPLALGRERVVRRQAELGARNGGPYDKDADDDAFQFAGADMIENAIEGFYDPRYPQQYCGGFSAFAAASGACSDVATFQAYRRNRVQDRLIHASRLNCHEYIESLRLLRSDTDSFFSVVRFGFEGAGAIFGNAAQVLSALAGSTGALNESTNQAYYNELAIAVIIEGIQAARAHELGEIRKRQRQSIADYTLESALADAASYHGACSLRSGLQKAEDAVSDERMRAEGRAGDASGTGGTGQGGGAG